MALINATAIPNADDYELEQSLKFDSGGTSYLSFTPSSAGNRKTWTWSGWVKRASLGTIQVLESVNAGSGNSNIFHIYLDSDDDIKISLSSFTIQTVAKYRDTSSWYHIMVVVDTTQATDTNRFKIYVNGTQQTLTTSNTYPSQNDDLAFNQTTEHNIGRREGDADRYTSSYLAELNFIDGQALTPADFGETGTYGEWKPIEYSGTYGTNGFYLPFSSDAITATGGTIGTYTSGGVNYKYHQFTSSGDFVVTSSPNGSNIDILVVAGGGGGGNSHSGGGGAGGLIDRTTLAVSAGTYTMTIGAGGAGGGSASPGDNGTDTTVVFNSSTILTAKGGGGGAKPYNAGENGGSGGAAGRSGGSNRAGGSQTQTGQSGDSGTYGFGNDGGAVNLAGGDTPAYPTGGGGGAGGAGGTVSSASGASGVGGVGRQNAYNGTNHYWAGGGGGHRYDTTGSAAAGAGGLGGGGGGAHRGEEGAGGAGGGSALNTGGSGANDEFPAGGGDGGTNTGGGGGAGAGDGGSGIVIVRYAV